MSELEDVELFAGPGGWSQGGRPLGIHGQGIELDMAAVATAHAAGHIRWCTGVEELDPADAVGHHPVRGLIGSPPCPQFSEAANRHGTASSAQRLLDTAATVACAEELEELLPWVREEVSENAALSLEPLRWAMRLEPQWIAWEQVPGVLPLWQACARTLEWMGYSTATGVLRAEQYGVPQARRRAFLVARSRQLTRDLGPARLPAPTHSRFWEKSPDRLDGESAREPSVLPWVSMHEAIGWGYLHRPAPTLVSQSGGGRRLLDGGSRTWARVREAIDAGLFVRAPHRAGLPVNRGDLSTCPIRDGALLQTFPADYPWQGTQTQQAKQVGNAVPPLLARAVLGEVSGLALAGREAAA